MKYVPNLRYLDVNKAPIDEDWDGFCANLWKCCPKLEEVVLPHMCEEPEEAPFKVLKCLSVSK